MPTLEDGKWGFPMQRIDADLLQRKADLGSKVHDMIASDLRKEFTVLDGKAEGYFNSYTKWYDIVHPEPVHIEKRFYNETTLLTGCIDLACHFKGREGRPGVFLVDWKCTVNPDPMKWPLQAAFYHLLMELNRVEIEPVAYFVQLDPDGKEPKVHDYLITPGLKKTALSLYNMYIYLTKNKQ
jgi:hypothetical protein